MLYKRRDRIAGDESGRLESQVFLMFQIMAVVFVAETTVMLVLFTLFHEEPNLGRSLLDSFFLTLIGTPVIYYLIIRPLNLRIVEKAQETDTVIRNVMIGIALIDQDGVIQTANPHLHELFGYGEGELTGVNIAVLIPKIDSGMYKAANIHDPEASTRYLSDKGAVELTGIKKGGGEIIIKFSYSTILLNNKFVILGMFRDITLRKQAEAEREKISEKFQSFFYLNPDPSVIIKFDGEVVDINQAVTEVLGYRADDMIGLKTTDIGLWVEHSARDRIVEQVRKAGYVHEVPVQFRHKSGRVLDILYSAQIIGSGGEIQMLSVARNITEQRKLNEKFQNFFYFHPEPCIVLSEDNILLDINQAAINNIGYSREEMIGRDIDDLEICVSPIDREIMFSMLYRDGYILDIPLQFKHKSGRILDVLYSAQLIETEGEKNLLAIIRDVTEQKKSEIKLRENEARLSEAQRIAELGSWELDIQNNIFLLSDEIFRIFEIDKGRFGGSYEAFLDAIHPDDREMVDNAYRTSLRDRTTYSIDHRLLFGGGRIKYIHEQCETFYNDAGKPIRSLGTVQDITGRKLYEQALNEKQLLAVEASRAKSEFLAVMSHEIRTPLNAIIGISDLLAEHTTDNETTEYIGILKRSGDHLLTLINDILDFSKLEAGEIELEHIDFDLVRAVEKVEEMMAVKTHQKGLELNYHIAPDVPPHIRGDQSRLMQILINLISNAVKFTEKGEVDLYISKAPAIPGQPGIFELIFAVRDTGIGIQQEKIPMLFEKFTQADSSTTRKYGGTGLGLAICKKLADIMGGSISVVSEPGVGSTFSFRIRFEESSSGHIHGETGDQVDITGIRILVVDDNATNRFILREILRGWGADAAEASNGITALRGIHNAHVTGQPYDLVLLDCQMPDMDGFEVARRIRDDEGDDLRTTIMMLTSENKLGYISKSKEAGISSYLIKPVKKSDLKKAILTALDRGPAAAIPHKITPEAESVALPELQSCKILVVDDAEDNRQLLLLYLRKLPCQVEIADNGETAVDMIKNGNYSIVLMDILMPVMDGLTATRIIRRWETEMNISPVPIVALTANAFREDEQKSLDAGCNTHLTKPIKKALLLDIVSYYTEKRGST